MNATKKLITLIAILTVAVSAMGQGRGMFGRGGAQMGPSVLLNRDDVKDELKLTTDQRGKIEEALMAAQQRGREAFQSLGIDFRNMTDDDRAKMAKMVQEQGAITEKEINGILTADQQHRLRELFVQQNGASVVTNPQFAKDLSLTEDQKSKIKDLQTKQMQAMRDLGQKVQDGDMDRQQMMEAMQKNQAIMKDEIGKILTDEQRAKIKEWSGAPFTFKDNPGGGR
jgi:Spy/CpxP family protein refolding chaperone